jgi:hypothetical protein
MRIVLAGVLLTGLLLVGVSVYQGTVEPEGAAMDAVAMEDGTPLPTPPPPPPTR